MKRFLNVLFDRNKYREVFIFITILFAISYFTPLSSILNLILLLWGAIIIIKDLLVKRIIFKSKKFIALIFFIIAYFITIISNRYMGLFENIKILALTSLQFFILFAFDDEDDKCDIYNHIIRFNNIIIKVTFITSLISLIIYLLGINFEFKNFVIGVENGMLNGVYTGANTGGPLAAISIVASILIMELKKSSEMNKFYIINIVIQLIFIYMTNSRATLYCIIIFGIMFAIFYFKDKKDKVIAGAGVFGIYLFSKIVNEVLYYIYICINNIIIIAKFAFNKARYYILLAVGKSVNNIDNKPLDITGSAGNISEVVEKEISMGFLNGRAQLWGCGMQILKDNFWFGVGSRNVSEVALNYASISELPGILGGGMHNIVIQVLVSNGVIGFIAIATFAVICLWEYFKYFFDIKLRTQDSKIVLIVFLILIMLLINNMAEANILYSASYMATVFWTYLGFGLFIISKEKREGKND